MFHLDNNSGVSSMPPAGAVESSAPRWFTEGGGGTPASYPGADWFNIVQAELLNVLSAYGVAPDKADLTQLKKAIEEAIKQKATAKSALLAAIAALNTSANKLPYFNGKDTVAMTDLTQLARTILGRANAADILSDLGLQFFISAPSSSSTAFTRVKSPDTNNSLVIANNGDWGAQDEAGKNIPLSIARGGTGAGNVDQTLINFGLDDVVHETRKINNKTLSADITLTAGDVSAVPSSRKVNNKPLSSDITLSAVDVGAPEGATAQICRAWCRMYVDSVTGNVQVISSHNISSVGRTSAGLYVPRFATNLPNADYAVVCSAYNEGAESSARVRVAGAGTRSVTGFNLYVADNNTDAAADANYVEFCVWSA